MHPGPSRLILSTVLVLSACTASAPPPGGLTRLESERVARIERGLAAAPRRVQDARLERYLASLLGRLDPAQPVRFYVLEGVAPQAELLGGELLRVRTGLLAAVRDEDELVFVLAHELAHRRLGHIDARRAPQWNALRAELAADRAAAEQLGALGYRRSAGHTLLLRLARDAPRAAAAQLLQPRIAALPAAADERGVVRASSEFDQALRRYRRRPDPD